MDDQVEDARISKRFGKPKRHVDRCETRIRTRLRTGKISDLQGRLIADVLVFDRSARGARIKLPTVLKVPDEIMFRDDAVDASAHARVCWRRDNEIGISLTKKTLRLCRDESDTRGAIQVIYRRAPG